ncbi:hypothetical protein KFK09_008430 [Dendrobium nobile]|uniref:Uncharacterized protein n=1 Tax=Dendrobium nobile TaxID=94219 RepID=A0A8T3BQV6_DENNO|nr:hypothetical protein KFK09_008430 [Dendrobium nobile]
MALGSWKRTYEPTLQWYHSPHHKFPLSKRVISSWTVAFFPDNASADPGWKRCQQTKDRELHHHVDDPLPETSLGFDGQCMTRPFGCTSSCSVVKEEFMVIHHKHILGELATGISRCSNVTLENNAYMDASLYG